MTPLVGRLLGLARYCSRTIRTRLIEPILADMEMESCAARLSGRPWLARWILLRGTAGLVTALAQYGMQRCAAGVTGDRGAARTMAFATGAFVLVTTILVLPPLMINASGTGTVGDLVMRGIYLVPQSVPLAIPVALAFGVLCGWSRGVTGRAMLRRVAVLGIAGLAITIAALEWLIPAANQAFRVEVLRTVSGATPATLPRGINEHSLSELAALLKEDAPAGGGAIQEAAARATFSAHAVEHGLHQRIALCLATVLLCLCAVSFAHAVRGPTLARSLFAVVTLLYVAAWSNLHAAVPAVGSAFAAWLPNAGLAAVSLIAQAMRSRPQQI